MYHHKSVQPHKKKRVKPQKLDDRESYGTVFSTAIVRPSAGPKTLRLASLDAAVTGTARREDSTLL